MKCDKQRLTTTAGIPVGDNQNSLTTGPRGPAEPNYGCGVAAGLGLELKEVDGLAKLPLADLIEATAQ